MKNDCSLQAKETALLALAQGDPDFPAFLDRYRQALPQVAELPAELVEELMAAVEEDRLLLEERSHNTDQNLRYSRELLEAEGCDLSQGVVVVSNGFHLTRARMLAERAGYDSVSTLAAPSSHLPSRLHMYVREPLALVKSFFLDR